jgi:hypothetical protein
VGNHDQEDHGQPGKNARPHLMSSILCPAPPP